MKELFIFMAIAFIAGYVLGNFSGFMRGKHTGLQIADNMIKKEIRNRGKKPSKESIGEKPGTITTKG